MVSFASIIAFLEQLAPPSLAEEWDNVGLLVGRRRGEADRVMTCLTITPATAAEAIRAGADLIVAHHPLPFRPLTKLTDETTPGALALDLASAGVAVYSPHTALDSAREGINQALAEGLGLRGIAPLEPGENGLGPGRHGWLAPAVTLAELVDRVRAFLKVEHAHWVGAAERSVRTLAVACGAAGSLLEAACRLDCDAMVLGETSFHACIEAEARGVGLVLPGHFASERFAVETLAARLAERFPDVEIWPSRDERDPIQWA
ncbi:MAG: Nif3-like dinuclear metal center hexameric protein [Pirellulales bacterium]|nr:Nif3-like dinuclear metal center hexameric protein [Pirellulales bacterium]